MRTELNCWERIIWFSIKHTFWYINVCGSSTCCKNSNTWVHKLCTYYSYWTSCWADSPYWILDTVESATFQVHRGILSSNSWISSSKKQLLNFDFAPCNSNGRFPRCFHAVEWDFGLTFDTLDCNVHFDGKTRLFINRCFAFVLATHKYFVVARNDILDGVFQCFTRLGFSSTGKVVMSIFSDVDDFRCCI